MTSNQNTIDTKTDHLIMRCAASAMSDLPTRLLQHYRIDKAAENSALMTRFHDHRQRILKSFAPQAQLVHRERLDNLRAWIKTQNLDAVLIPRSDIWLNEYIPPRWEHVAWLTGFTGSHAQVAISKNDAMIVSDGRYREQIAAQVDPTTFRTAMIDTVRAEVWLKETLVATNPDPSMPLRIGIDPSFISVRRYQEITALFSSPTFKIVDMTSDPFDELWPQRPPPPLSNITAHPHEFSGQSCVEKCQRITTLMEKNNAHAALIYGADLVCWLLNCRASDVANTPIWLAAAMLERDNTITLYSHESFLPASLTTAWGASLFQRPHSALATDVMTRIHNQETLVYDPVLTPQSALVKCSQADKARLIPVGDQINRFKAQRNNIELIGSQKAHHRDAVVMAKTLAWVMHTPPDQLFESDVEQKILRLRQNDMLYRSESFSAISAVGPHAAMPHYRLNDASNALLKSGQIYLLDCGAQYLDGTTDITRCMFIGTLPPRRMTHAYTLVLKGMIALSQSVFPYGTRCRDLDPLARQFLWQSRLNYNHGTGHGVGSYLSVHEGPYSISHRCAEVIPPGVILSNEPGYYQPDDFGIRIENLIYSIPTPTEPTNAAMAKTYSISPQQQFVTNPNTCDFSVLDTSPDWLYFITLTYCPFDKSLIDKSMLTNNENAWINAYHAAVKRIVKPHLEEPYEKSWLDEATSAL